MKNISAVSDSKDIVTVEYLDDVTAIADKSSSFTINNTVNYPLLALTAYGRSWQNYASHGDEPLGKNLLDNTAESKTENGITFTVNNDKSVTVTGSLTVAAETELLCKGYYVLSSGNYIATLGNERPLLADFFAQLWKIKDGSAVFVENMQYSNELTFTVEESALYYIRIVVKNYVSANATIYPMIRHADVTDDTYEPYYSNPNPDCPVPIESIGDSGSLTVTICRKNLLSYAESGVKTRNGLTVESFGNGEYHVHGTVTAAATVIKFPLVCPSFIPDAKIYLSLNNTSAYSNIASISFADTDGNEIGSLGINTVNRVHATSTYNGKTIAAVSFYVANGNSVDYYIKPQFEIDNATEYEHYKSTAATVTTGLPLRGLPVSNGGNYTDSNGQEWICDTLEYNYSTAVEKQRVVVIDNYNGETVEGDYISTTGGLDVGASVIYPAGNVIETPLTADEINQLRGLVTFDGVTNIFNSENADMSVEYLTSKSVSKAVMPIITALRGDNNA